MSDEGAAPNVDAALDLGSSTATRILRINGVVETVGKSRTSIWRDVRDGNFPAPLQLGPNSIGWIEAEVLQWLADRPRVSYAPSPSEPAPEPQPESTAPSRQPRAPPVPAGPPGESPSPQAAA